MALPERPSRPRAALGALLTVAFVVLAFAAAPAAAKVVESEAGVKVGLQPRSTDLLEGVEFEGEEAKAAQRFANADGNPVVSSAKVYAIYWDPHALYDGDWQEIINNFFANMAKASDELSTVLAVDSQYSDTAGAHAGEQTTFAGAFTDTEKYPTNGCTAAGDEVACLTKAQLEAQLGEFITDHSLPKGLGTIYYVLTPPGVTDCLEGGAALRCSEYTGSATEEPNTSYSDSFCSYHAAIDASTPEGSGETVLYAAMPWTAGTIADDRFLQKSDTYETQGYTCQDGGWEALTAEEPGEVEAHEKTPHEQEPNGIGLSPDGTFDSGLADTIVTQIASEQQDIVTNPLLNAWQTPGGEEATDICRDYFAPSLGGNGSESETTHAGTLDNDEFGDGAYYVNDAYNLAGENLFYPGIPCLKGVSLEPSFTAPTNANAGEAIGFDGMQSNVTLDAGTSYASGKASATYATYEWNFGDGTIVKGYAPGAPSSNSTEATPCEVSWLSPCAGSVFHTYTYGGTYRVTLTITDTGGQTASVSEPVVVVGPEEPSAGSKGSEGGGVSTNTGTSTSTQGGSGGSNGTTGSKSSSSGKSGKSSKTTVTPTSPKLTALVLTKSTKALTNGLRVHYSVNEQAAGRFEVMIPSSVAKRLGLKGASASDLPAGTKPQTVIAQALLVTTRSASRTISISIPSKDRKPLSKLASLSVMLRLSARDASASKPLVSVARAVATLTR